MVQKIAQNVSSRKSRKQTKTFSSRHIKPLPIFRHFRLFSFWYSGKMFLISPPNIVLRFFIRKCRYKISSRHLFRFGKGTKITEWDLFNMKKKTSDIEKNVKAEFLNGKSIDINSHFDSGLTQIWFFILCLKWGWLENGWHITAVD